MPPTLALAVWAALLIALLVFDPAREAKSSLALWVPLSWLFIVGSQLPSQWMDIRRGSAVVAYEEGNSLDRIVYTALIVLAIGILVSRSFKWGTFFARNKALTAFIFFGLVSVLWSDFPSIALKRWFRDLGNYLMILVVLSDPRQMQAIRTVLRRLSYLLIPLSLLLVKYYPDIGRQFDIWTGAPMNVGATTSKNLLGALCLVSGLFFLWDTALRWPDRKERQTKRILLVNLAFLWMALWLLGLSSSATSTVCFAIGCIAIIAAHRRVFKRHPGFLKALMPICFLLYLLLAFGLGLNADFTSAVGRNPTFTGRTNIWNSVLSMHTNPLLGTGYESFWLGPRIQEVWRLAGKGINEAHNGYLEVYLNLGLIGLFILCVFLIVSYRSVCRRLTTTSLGPLALALWSVVVFYNITEAAFKGHLVWIAFLLGAIVIPPAAPDVGNAGAPSFEESRVAEAALRSSRDLVVSPLGSRGNSHVSAGVPWSIDSQSQVRQQARGFANHTH
jgi:exopolysaccharide production protein ExoQ